MATIETNLFIENLSFAELRVGADSDGVYRGSVHTLDETEQSVAHEELLNAAYGADVSPLIMQLGEDLLQTSKVARPVTTSADVREVGSAITQQSYRLELTVGYEDLLASLAQGGTALLVHVSLLYSYWTVFLDPNDHSLRAAMKVFYPPQATPRS